MNWLRWLLSLFARPAPPPAPKPPPGPAPAVDPAAELRAAINAFRRSRGKPLLLSDSKLDRSALAWARTMDRDGVLRHGNFEARLEAVYPGRAGEENIAEGQQTGAEVVSSWANEKPDAQGRRGHLENLLADNITAVGCARAGRFWVADFLVQEGASKP